MHPNRSARAHLRFMAASNRIPAGAVDEVLDIVGLSAVADKAAGKFSLGMKQRLGLAGAMLGDPRVLLFDEPVNGLDPGGHLLDPDVHEEPGRAGTDGPRVLAPAVRDGIDGRPSDRHRARPADRRLLDRGLHRPVDPDVGPGPFAATRRAAQRAARKPASRSPTSTAPSRCTDAPIEQIGDLAGTAGITLHELSAQAGSLEEAFIQMTGDSVEYGHLARATRRTTGRRVRAGPGGFGPGPAAHPGSRGTRRVARLPAGAGHRGRARGCRADHCGRPAGRLVTRRRTGRRSTGGPPPAPSTAQEGWDRR